MYIIRGYRLSSYMKVTDSRSRLQEQNGMKCEPTAPDFSDSMTAAVVSAGPFQSFRI